MTDQQHSYSVYWKYTLTVTDENGKPEKNKLVTILDKNKAPVAEKKTANDGSIEIELPQYSVNGSERTDYAPYTIKVGDRLKQVDLNNNVVDRIKL